MTWIQNIRNTETCLISVFFVHISTQALVLNVFSTWCLQYLHLTQLQMLLNKSNWTFPLYNPLWVFLELLVVETSTFKEHTCKHLNPSQSKTWVLLCEPQVHRVKPVCPAISRFCPLWKKFLCYAWFSIIYQRKWSTKKRYWWVRVPIPCTDIATCISLSHWTQNPDVGGC